MTVHNYRYLPLDRGVTGDLGPDSNTGPSFSRAAGVETDSAMIDYLTVVFSLDFADGFSLVEFVRELNLEPLAIDGSHRNGYQVVRPLVDRLGNRSGFLAYGGNMTKDGKETSCVVLPGSACSVINSWMYIHDFIINRDGWLTRIDLCYDDYAGLFDVASARQAYDDDLFTVTRKPLCKLYDDCGHNTGCTFEVGNRAGFKLYRGYEKGKQLGDPLSNWVRHEVQFRKKKNILPLDMLLSPGPYLAGAYPYLDFVCGHASRIKQLRKTGEISYDVMLKNLCHHYGRALNVINELNPDTGDFLLELKKAMRDGVPSRLKLPSISNLN